MPRESSPSPPTDPEEIGDVKSGVRSQVRTARLSRSEKRREEAAIAIASHVLAMPEARDAECVSVYASRATEPSTTPLIEALASHGKRVILPLLGDGLQRGWGDYIPGEPLEERAPGRPPEPASDFSPAERLAEADLIVVPALGVDQEGTRLGQGGGWYDRALEFARPDVMVVATCFDDEVRTEDDPLPREPHDVPVNAYVTPSGVTVLNTPNAS